MRWKKVNDWKIIFGFHFKKNILIVVEVGTFDKQLQCISGLKAHEITLILNIKRKLESTAKMIDE